MDPLGGLSLRGCMSPAPYWNEMEASSFCAETLLVGSSDL